VERLANGGESGTTGTRAFRDLVLAATDDQILAWTARARETYNLHPNEGATTEELRIWLIHCYTVAIPRIEGEQEIDPFTGASLEELRRREEEEERRDKKREQEARDVAICAEHNLTDFGNAERFIRRFGEQVRYCAKWDLWFTLDENQGVWKKDEKNAIKEYARSTLTNLYGEIAVKSDPSVRENIAKWAIKCERSHHVQEIISLSMSRPEVVILPDDLDSDDWKICLENGVYDLREHRLLPQDPKALHTRIIPVKYQEGRMAPMWIRFLDRIFRGREDKQELIDFLQRAAGYTLSGCTDEQCLFLLYGAGANGKSVFLEVLRAVMGGSSGYAKVCDAGTFTTSRNECVRNDIAGLAGVRLVTTNENPRGSWIDEALIKEITGEREITARFLFKDFFTFRPRFKIWWAFNHQPRIGDNTWSIWRRIRMIPFQEQIPPEEQNPHLADDLITAELPGILNWCIEGLRKYQESGLPLPSAIKAATDEYREDQDILHEFVSLFCVTNQPGAGGLASSDLSETAKNLYQAYVGWCAQNNEKKMSKTRFGRELAERGFKKSHTMQGNIWRGLKLQTGWYEKLYTSEMNSS